MESSFLSSVVLPVSLGVIMFGLGLTLSLNDFTRVLRRPKATMTGLFCQLIILPAIAFCLSKFFSLESHSAVGLMLLSLVPGAVTSNFFTALARGSVALSVTLTAIVSMIAPFTLPVLLGLSLSYFYNSSAAVNLPFAKTCLSLLSITLIPVLLGMLVKKFSFKLAKSLDIPLRKLSTLILLGIVFALLKKHWDLVPQSFNSVGMVCLLFNLSTLGMGYSIAHFSGLTRKEAMTIAIESGFQSSAMALFIAGTFMKQPQVAIVPAVYSLIMLCTGIFLVSYLTKGEQIMKQQA